MARAGRAPGIIDTPPADGVAAWPSRTPARPQTPQPIASGIVLSSRLSAPTNRPGNLIPALNCPFDRFPLPNPRTIVRAFCGAGTFPRPPKLDLMMKKGDVKKVVLAYSGGLDTSIILKWLQTELRLRGRHLHGRSRPGRRACAGARQGAAARHQAGEHLHRRPARRIRARLRVPDVPRQHGLRGPVSARHVDRAAADRQEADRDRREGRRRRGVRMARPARATIRCGSNSPIMR